MRGTGKRDAEPAEAVAVAAEDAAVDAAADAAEGAVKADVAADRASQAAARAEEAAEQLAATDQHPLGKPGEPLQRHSAFYIGFFGGLGALVAWWLGQQILAVGSILILVVVAMFLAAGLNPVVEFFMRRGMKRTWAVLCVIVVVLIGITLFISAIVPVISDQVALLTKNAPGWLDQLTNNKQVKELDEQYDVIDKVRDYVQDGDFVSRVTGGALGVGIAVLSALANTFIVVVLMLYFLASLPTTKEAIYRLAPATRRERVGKLGDQVIRSVGGYVSGAFLVAVCAGISSLIFLFIVGLGEYAVALSFVVALLSLIPMVGATIAMVLVSLIGLTVSPGTAIACFIFYLAYQQLENYLIYPKVMARSVNVPGSVTVVAALLGGTLLGFVGALMAVPTAAAILMLTREIFIRRQDAR